MVTGYHVSLELLTALITDFSHRTNISAAVRNLHADDYGIVDMRVIQSIVHTREAALGAVDGLGTEETFLKHCSPACIPFVAPVPAATSTDDRPAEDGGDVDGAFGVEDGEPDVSERYPAEVGVEVGDEEQEAVNPPTEQPPTGTPAVAASAPTQLGSRGKRPASEMAGAAASQPRKSLLAGGHAEAASSSPALARGVTKPGASQLSALAPPLRNLPAPVPFVYAPPPPARLPASSLFPPALAGRVPKVKKRRMAPCCGKPRDGHPRERCNGAAADTADAVTE